MSDYTKATNFTLKDDLTTGDPGKVIKGSEIDAEYTAIASAVASKADLNSPTFTGTPTLPSGTIATTVADTADSSTKIATTAFVSAVIAAENLDTMATQASDSVAITGGTITGTTVNGNTVGSNSVGARTVSTSDPTGGSDGDIHYKVAS